MIYLDHNATTATRPEVLEAMLPFLKEEYGNASSLYQLGQHSRKAVENARAQIAQLIGAQDPYEIIFTSGGTESNNAALKGIVKEYAPKGKRVVSSAIEHSSIRNVLQFMEEEQSIDNVVVSVQKNGIVNAADIQDALTADTVLVTVMGANNETGAIQPIKLISDLCRQKGILMHCDAVQMAGKTSLRVEDMGIDTLSLSGHKFGAPKGVGALYIRKGTRLKSFIQGGRQERNRRGGTENVPHIVGMGKAAELALKETSEEARRLKNLRDLFESLLMKNLTHCFINGDKDNRTANTANICFEYTDSSEMIMALDLKGVACSSGSACAAGSADPSHVLLAMGLPQEKAHASLRFSLGHGTMENDIRSAAQIISATVSQLRERHPLWKKAVNG